MTTPIDPADLLDHLNDAIVITDLTFTITWWGHGAEELYGWQAAEVVGRKVAGVVDTLSYLDGTTTEQAERRLLADGRWRGVVTQRHRSGRLLYVDAAVFMVRDSAGAMAGVFCINRDMSERFALLEREAQARADADSSLAQLQTVLDSAPFGIALVDADLRFLQVNLALSQLNQLPVTAHLGRRIDEVLPIASRKIAPLVRAVLASGEPVLNQEFVTQHQPGDMRRTWQTSYYAVRNQSGAIIGAVAFVVELTERRRLEAQLTQAQKMEAVGRLAGGIAHEFNNILTTIAGHTALVRGALRDSQPAIAEVDAIQRATEQAATLTRQLLTLARQQISELQTLGISALLRDLRPQLQDLLGPQIALDMQLAPDLAGVRGDQRQLEQLVLSLAQNAREAMPGGGRLVISARHRPAEQPTVAGGPPGDVVELTLRDTGHGMDSATLARAFEPFFTTRAESGSSGLGLATAYAIVSQHGGEITIESRAGHGTLVRVRLPAIAAPSEVAMRPPAGGSGGETILVVEDNRAVRQITARLLMLRGYQVLEAADAPEALAIARETAPISLVLSDVRLPTMNGRALAEELRKIQPQLLVLFMSGYTEGVLGPDGRLDPEIAFIQKPFRAEELASRIRQLLDRARA